MLTEAPAAPPPQAQPNAEPRTSNVERRTSSAGPRNAGIVALKDIHRELLPDGVRVTIDLDAEVAFHQEEVEKPRRVFFDLRGVRPVSALQDATLKFHDDVVREIRLGRHPQNTTRIVLDMEGVEGYTVYPLYSPYRLVIDLKRATAAKVTSAVAPPVVASLPAPPPATASNPAPPSPPPVAQPVPDPEPIKMPLPSKTAAGPIVPPAAAAANSNGKFSISRQLGLGVSRVVIDAGHGGHDPGAQAFGVNESEVTLDVAQRLQKLLEKQPGVDVVMTRDTDVFIPLQERTAIANREGADLFLSVHVNASRNAQARGIETYFLNFATNPEAEAVAARENAGSGQTMHNLPDIVKAIALNNKINESRDFAETVQRSMIKKVRQRNRAVKDLGVKQAPFVVLIGAGMPSVLAEISFVTNKQEGTLLKSPTYRQQIAQALLDAILSYQKSLRKAEGLAGKKAATQ
jgi:N-acetylmuramoyl-L-alanine amidase